MPKEDASSGIVNCTPGALARSLRGLAGPIGGRRGCLFRTPSSGFALAPSLPEARPIVSSIDRGCSSASVGAHFDAHHVLGSAGGADPGLYRWSIGGGARERPKVRSQGRRPGL